MPLTARQLRQPLTIEAIGRVLYFADVLYLSFPELYFYSPFNYIPLLNLYRQHLFSLLALETRKLGTYYAL